MVRLLRRKKSVVLIDLPQLTRSPIKFDLFTLSAGLHKEFEEVVTFARIPRNEDMGAWGLLGVAAKAGLSPVLCPADPDPIIASTILELSRRDDVTTIALLSGDTGFFLALKIAKRNGKRTKVILPPGSESKLLKLVADEVDSIERYAGELTTPSVRYKEEMMTGTVVSREG